MRLPVKDRKTQPYISEREIPAVKAALSAWRKLRKHKDERQHWREFAASLIDPVSSAHAAADEIGWRLERLVAIEERIRKEADHDET